MWDKVTGLYQEYAGTGFILGLYCISVFYLFFTEKKKNIRIYFLYVPLVILILFFNPLFAGIVYSFTGNEIYYRILWLIPVSVTCALAAVRVIFGQKGKMRIFATLAVLIIMMAGGRFVYSNPYFSTAENIHHVPQKVVDLCDAIHVDGREVLAVFPAEMLQYVRQYDPTVCMPYGREVTVERWTFRHTDELYAEMEKKAYDAEKIAELARKRQCHFVIVDERKKIKGSFEDCGYVEKDEIGGYRIYQDPTVYIGF